MGSAPVLRIDNQFYTSGIISVDEHGQIQFPGDLQGQTSHVYTTILGMIHEIAGDNFRITRLRIALLDSKDLDVVLDIHRARIGYSILGVSTIIVKEFLHPEALIQLEMDGLAGS